MRLWSLNPSCLDSIGLVALWREGLLARKVLSGETTGYRNHPQLKRFKEQHHPLEAIDSYLTYVYEEANRRGFHFDGGKITHIHTPKLIPLPSGQLEYEIHHLENKLKHRNPAQWLALREISIVQSHPLFYIVDGSVCDWEIIDQSYIS